MKAWKKILLAYFFFAAITAVYSITIMDFLKGIVPAEIKIIAFSPVDTLTAVIYIIFFTALVPTLPLIIYEILRYFTPTLYDNEKKFLYSVLPLSTALFIIGAIIGFYTIFFFGLTSLAELGKIYGIENLWSITGIVELFFLSMLGFGAAFQFPIILFHLIKFNLLSLSQLNAARPTIIVGLLIIAAFLTPSPDAVSQLILFCPLYLLFEGTIFFSRNNEKEEVTA
jgi:sec-independent protein translocase protein TatC